MTDLTIEQGAGEQGAGEDFGSRRRASLRRGRLLASGVSLAALGVAAAMVPGAAAAQVAPPPNIVGACSGVSLPRSVVTDILRPVVSGIVTPVQGTVNPILGVVGAVLPLVPPLSIDAAGLLDDAAAGNPITLQVLNANGLVVGPADRCDVQADSFTLRTPQGIAIGGNRITGLGATGQEAFAAEASAIAFGNGARTAAGATGAIALGAGAQAGGANGVALGAGSIANRAPQAGYAALGLAAPQTSAGEVSIGAAGAERQLTNVAAGQAATDAVNVGQLAGVAAQVGAVANTAVLYDGATRDRVTLAGANGTVIDNLAAGTVGAGSREAVNGSQLFATNTVIQQLTTSVTNGAIGAVRYSDAATPTVPNGGTVTNDVTLVGAAAAPVGLHNVAAGTIGAGSTDAINGAQLAGLGQSVAAGIGGQTQYDPAGNALAVSIGYGGTQYSSVQSVFDAVDGSVNGGAGIRYFRALSTRPDGVVTGTDSLAIGPEANAAAANSVALGTGASALRGGQAGYAALGLGTPQTSVGEVSVGSAGALRQITNVAAGTEASDAATVGQVAGVAAQVAAVSDSAVKYDGAARDTVTLAGAGGTRITNVTAGTIGAGSTDAINGAQLAGLGQSIAASFGGLTQYNPATNALALSIGYGGTQYSNLQSVFDVVDGSINGGAGIRYFRVLSTRADGVVTGTDSLAIGPEANAAAANSVALGTGASALRGGQTGYAAIGLGALQASAGEVSVGSAGALRQITNVAAGSAATDAATVGQVAGVAAQVAAVSDSAVKYDSATRDTITLAGNGGTRITNVAAGTVAAGSTDAVNGAQLNATNVQVTANTTAITNLGNTIANGGVGPVQYANAATPTTPNGGVRTNDLTLVGAAAGPVGLHNVADGRIAVGSTDAVNGGQVAALAQASANAVTYNTVNGVRTNTVTLAGGNAAVPVTIANVAAGTLAPGSTEAVNGAQLAATNQVVSTVQTTANTALSLGQNAVQYDAGRGSVTINPGSGAIQVRNVASGTAPTDAVNVMQMNTGLAGAVTQANAYTDSRIGAINFDLRQMRREANAGTAGALAAAGLPQAYEAGKGMIAIAGGTYRSASAMAVGFSKAFNDGHTVVKLAGSYDSRDSVGASGGIGYQF